mmetsp:Transcript_4864/g.13645  ORF Transcript_4864/g.13645 Transcript_4864/m.13645 type:complete len:254 (-) Transcript_4864:173-934(-)
MSSDVWGAAKALPSGGLCQGGGVGAALADLHWTPVSPFGGPAAVGFPKGADFVGSGGLGAPFGGGITTPPVAGGGPPAGGAPPGGAVPPTWDPALSPLPPGQAAGGVGAGMQPFVPGRVPAAPGPLSPIRRLSRAGSASPRRRRNESRSTSPVAFARSGAMEDTGRSRRSSFRTVESSTPMSQSLPNLVSDGLGPQAAGGPDSHKSQIKYRGTVFAPKAQRPVLKQPDPSLGGFRDSFAVVPLRSQGRIQALR